MDSTFEWDEVKAAANWRKHRVTFEFARRAFADPFAIVVHDRIESGEYRWQTIGMIDGVAILLVAHSFPRGEEGVVRIISARHATPAERRYYDRANRAQLF